MADAEGRPRIASHLGGGFEPEECGVCALERGERRWPELLVVVSEHWLVRHHGPPAPLVGWCQLITRRHVQGPARFNEIESADFGPRLSSVASAIERLTGALRVYAIAFGEGAQHAHLHLVPRLADRPETAAWGVADWYRDVEAGRRQPAATESVLAFVAALRAELLACRSPRWDSPT